MIRHILVPLDGSDLSEAALPVAAALAARLEASVSLVHVLEKRPPREVHGRPHLTALAAAQSYLAKVAAQAFAAEVRVQTHVQPSGVENVARAISDHAAPADGEGVDLIVMCAHGRSGARRALAGTLAQRILSRGGKPVLMLPPRITPGLTEFRCRSILAPVDRDPEHFPAVHLAGELAAAFQAAMHLLLIVPTFATLYGGWVSTGRLLPGTTSRLLDLAVAEDEKFLGERKAELQRQGLSVSSQVTRGDPARVINSAVRALQPDLIVLGTHGKSGLEAVWEGSVASKVLRRSRVPLLLVPVGRKE